MPVKTDDSGDNEDVIGRFSIVSPYTGESADFVVVDSETQVVKDAYFKSHCSNELVETIVFSCYDNDELLKDQRLRKLVGEVQPNQAASLQALVDHFNALAQDYFRRHGPYASCATEAAPVNSPDVARSERATSFEYVPGVALRRLRHPRFLSHVVQLCYNRAVSEPNELNKQKPFSTQTYGETMFPFVEYMVKHLYYERDPDAPPDPPPDAEPTQIHEFPGWTPKNLSPDDRFIDLGSGVGQVVIQMAASVEYKRPVVGIEKAIVPQRYAENMAREFVNWMRFYARGYSPFVLIGDDFLDPVYADLVKRSTVVFANNFLFGPRVDFALSQLFAELPEGARVVSSKRFCDELAKITERTENDISAIMRVEVFEPLIGAVSWTSTAFSFYLQTIDRTRLERYYYYQRHPELGQDPHLVQLPPASEPPSVLGVNTACISRSNSLHAPASSSGPSKRLSSARRTVAKVCTAVTRVIADEDSQSPATPSALPSDADADSRDGETEIKAKKRKQQNSSSVLQLFHTQADSLASGTIRQRTASGCNDSDQYDPTSVYPSSSFNLPAYNNFSRERNEARRSGALPRLPRCESRTNSSAASSCNKRPVSTSASTSLSGTSSGVFSTARRPDAPLKVSPRDLQDTARRISQLSSSPASLFTLLRAQVDRVRSRTCELEKKKSLLARFLTSQRARLHALLADYSRLEFAESRQQRSNTDSQSVPDSLADLESASRILLEYARRARTTVDAKKRRKELKARIAAAKRKLDAQVTEVKQSTTNGVSHASPVLLRPAGPPNAFFVASTAASNGPPSIIPIAAGPQYATPYLVTFSQPVTIDCAQQHAQAARLGLSPPHVVRPIAPGTYNILSTGHPANISVPMYTAPLFARPPNTI